MIRSFPRARRRALAVAVAVALVTAAGCGADDVSSTSTTSEAASGGTVRVVTHDSFAVSEEVLEAFEAETGITVELVKGGDAVTVVNQAILTNGNPQGDVLFGIDNSLLTRAYDEGLFEPYESPALVDVDQQFQLDAEHRVTPVDFGDVCVNYDREFFAAEGLAVPTTLEDLADPAYAGLLVVENPTTSSPGLAFMLGTQARFGDGWLDYWSDLQANDVEIADGWEQAYFDRFSGGANAGDRPLVVSYASSPPVEVTDPATPADAAPTGVIADTCYRQIEFAGVLQGAENPANGERFIDFLLSVPFQEDMPGQMYVYPVNAQAQLPTAFTIYSVVVEDPLSLPPDVVAANRDTWLEQWSELIGG